MYLNKVFTLFSIECLGRGRLCPRWRNSCLIIKFRKPGVRVNSLAKSCYEIKCPASWRRWRLCGLLLWTSWKVWPNFDVVAVLCLLCGRWVENGRRVEKGSLAFGRVAKLISRHSNVFANLSSWHLAGVGSRRLEFGVNISKSRWSDFCGFQLFDDCYDTESQFSVFICFKKWRSFSVRSMKELEQQFCSSSLKFFFSIEIY